MTTPHKQLIEDVASARGVESFVVCKVITNDKYAVTMLPAFLADLGDFRVFVEYLLERPRIPLVEIKLLVVLHVHVNSNILLDGLPG